MKLAILYELINRRITIHYQPVHSEQLTFFGLRWNTDNYAIVTKEGTKIEICEDSEKRDGNQLVTETVSDIENIIYSCVNEYREWREQCLTAAASSQSVNEVLDVCASLLSNPVALFDKSLILSAYSGKIPSSIRGTIWDEVLSHGLSRPEIYSKAEADMIASQLSSGKKSFVWKSELFKGQTHICAQVYRKGTPCGILGASDLYGGFSDGEAMLVEDTSDFISLFYSSHGEALYETNLYYIERMLNGLSVNKAALKKSIEPLGWDMNDTYQVFAMRKGVPHEYANISFRNRLQKQFPRSLLMIHEDRPVLIANLSKEPKQNIEELLKTYGFALGTGFSFSRLDHLYYAYVQSLIALSFAKETESVAFSSVYSRYLLESIAKLTDVRSLCHPVILSLAESEDESDRILTENLKMYLLCGRSTAETARRLFIHRNTLLYRLEKLSKLLETDLSQLDENDAFILLISCMIITAENS